MYNLHIIMFPKAGQIQDVGKKERKSTSRKCAVRKGANRRVKKDPLAFVFYIVGLLVGIAACIALKGM